MYRPAFTAAVSHYHTYSPPWPEALARFFVALTIWMCVSVSIIYGYYGDRRMLIGPSTSRLFKLSSMFVEQVRVTDVFRKGVSLYVLTEEPELSLITNWNATNYVFAGSYSRQGFYLWLNKGSSIHLRWAAPSNALGQIQVSFVKGEQRHETLLPTSTSNHVSGREAEYNIKEDDRYYVAIENFNSRTIIVVMNVNVSSKMYDTTNARTMCSTMSGSCHLNFGFPSAQFILVTTPNNGDLNGWNVELSFEARIVTYLVLLEILGIIIFVTFKYLGGCASNIEQGDEEDPRVQEVAETSPLLGEKTCPMPYGTVDLDSNTSSSSDELHDEMICVICYDMPRNCFFIPCGHCATCSDCAQRIVDVESRVCPICRRLIHSVRKLIIP